MKKMNLMKIFFGIGMISIYTISLYSGCKSNCIGEDLEEYKRIQRAKELKLKEDDFELKVFVSFSMPEKSLVDISDFASKIGAKVVFKGFLENSYRKTAAKIEKLKINCEVDPRDFDYYRIDRVPCFVLAKKSPGENGIPLHDIVAGNVSTMFALERMLERGDLKKEAKALILRARKGSFFR